MKVLKQVLLEMEMADVCPASSSSSFYSAFVRDRIESYCISLTLKGFLNVNYIQPVRYTPVRSGAWMWSQHRLPASFIPLSCPGADLSAEWERCRWPVSPCGHGGAGSWTPMLLGPIWADLWAWTGSGNSDSTLYLCGCGFFESCGFPGMAIIL